MGALIMAVWIIGGFFLLDMNLESFEGAPMLNKIIAGLIIVIGAPVFVITEILEIILGYLTGGEDDES